MKILFLDFDGVLNSEDSFRRYEPKTWDHVDPMAVRRLKLLLDDMPDLKIVISSTWRRMMKIDEMRSFLGGFRIDPNRIIDYTPRGSISDCIRGREIHLWLEDHPEVGSFVILDDDNDMGNYMDHLVQTSHKIGLQDSDIEKIKEKLK